MLSSGRITERLELNLVDRKRHSIRRDGNAEGPTMSGVQTQISLHVVREPKVYLLGRQVVDEEALSAFLSDHEVSHWTTDTEVAAEKLIETAGRVCYLSFAKPRPGGNKA